MLKYIFVLGYGSLLHYEFLKLNTGHTIIELSKFRHTLTVVIMDGTSFSSEFLRIVLSYGNKVPEY